MLCLLDNVRFQKTFKVSPYFVFLFNFFLHVRIISDPIGFQKRLKWTYLIFQ